MTAFYAIAQILVTLAACVIWYKVGYDAGYSKGSREGIWDEIARGATVIFGKDKGTKCPMCGQERK